MNTQDDEKKSHDMELISEPKTSEMDRRRLMRFVLAKEQFRIKDTGKIFPIADLSHEGLALRLIDKEDGILFTVGRHIEGTLNLEGAKFSISAQVKNLRADVVGCEFKKDLPQASRAAIEDYILPAHIGSDLKPSPTSPAADMLWLHGRCGTELLIWLEAGDLKNVRKWILFVGGFFVEWIAESASEDRFTTGRTEHSSQTAEVRGVLRYETTVLLRDSALDASRLGIAKQVILGCNSLGEYKTKLILCFGDA